MFCVYCGAEQQGGDACGSCHMVAHAGGDEEIEPAYRALAHRKQFFPMLLTDVAHKGEEDGGALMYCFVERYRGKHIHTFHLYREADNSFVMACSMLASQSGALYFHTKQSLFNRPETVLAHVPTNPLHPDFIAALVPNSFLGTEFLLTKRPKTSSLMQAVLTPSKPRSAPGMGEEVGSLLQDIEQQQATTAASASVVEELAMIVFATNLSASTPNQIKAYVRTNPRCRTKVPMRQRMRQASLTRAPSDLPALIFDRIASTLTPRNSADKSSVDRGNLTFYNALAADNEEEEEQGDDNQKDDISIYQNRKATWNEKVNGWTLDFNGRVQVSSKKNFILVPTISSNADNAGNGAIGVRFGKASKHRFSLDYRYPFSPLSAFAVAMSMFTSKLAVAW